jgi:hypothetical protein
VDDAKRQAIEACGRCGLPEDAHKHRAGTDEGDLALFAALGGPCERYVASDAAVIYQQYLGIAGSRAPRRDPGTGRVGKRNPLCRRCLNRHRGECVIAPGPGPGPGTLARGLAKAREALGLTRDDEPEAS